MGHILLSLLSIQFFPPTLGLLVGLVVLVLLLMTSAFISGSESACFSLSPPDLKRMETEQGVVPAYRLSLSMLRDQDRLLATILITNNLVNIAIVILSTYLTGRMVDFSGAPIVGFLVEVVLITFLILLFGEVLPKLFGAARPLRYLAGTARALYSLYVVLKPFASPMARAVSRLNARLSPRVDLSIKDLGEALNLTEGHLPEEQRMLRRIVHYDHIDVCEIMKPRMDVVAVDIDEPYQELKRIVLESGFSRIPVYRESFDQVVGLLYVKDLLPYIDEPDDFNWTRLLRQAYFVPENKKIHDLFNEFQQHRIHLAIIVDEYGGTCGIVTLEDILEEVFGEIQDESDDTRKLYKRIGERSYIFQAKIQINDLCKVLGIDDEELDEVRGEAETLAGLVLEQLGRFPVLDEELTIRGLRLQVKGVSNRRIDQIRVDY